MDKNVYRKAGKRSAGPELESTEVEKVQTEQEQVPEFRLQIRLFGAFDVRLDGVPIPPLRSRKVQWLLALLALRNEQALDRVWLAGTLWPDSAPEQALYNLRQSLTNIRHALGKAAVCLRASMVNALSFDVAAAEVDVLQFDAATAAGTAADLERAVALYRGSLLEGCSEEWVVAERRLREERYLDALDRLAQGALGREDRSVALRCLRAAVQTDPYREQTQRVLIRTLAEQGDYAAAVQVYRDLRLLLHRELNSEPDPETLALFQSIQTAARLKRAEAPSLPPPSTPPSIRRLPYPLSPLIGRQAEREQIVRKLEQVRLLTLAGPGGVGKTRLAIAVAEQVVSAYPDGVFCIDLAPLTDPARVAQTIATALQIREAPDASLLSTLQEALASKTLMLMLDNCEHLLDSCAVLADALLKQCPRLRILATSRQALGLTGEVVWKVPSLSTPALADLASRRAAPWKDSIALLSEYEAVQLFVVRAQEAAPDFCMTSRNAETIARICAHLDGLPLAIELAAARIRALSVEEIARKLDNRFRLLTGGNRAALPRQKTLRALLDWSYDLLNEAERALFCRLAVFAGGWNLEAAEEVCGAESDRVETAFEAWETLDLLSALVDKSLVVREAGEEQTRCRLLETMRQYAWERLQERGEAEEMQRRHQAFFARLAEEAETELTGPGQANWLHRLEQEHDNLRQALKGGDPEAALRLAGALWRYLQIRGYISEGREWLLQALTRTEAQGATLARAKALNGAGILAWAECDYAAANTWHEASLALSRELRDANGIARALQGLGNIAAEHGNFEAARTLYTESLSLRRALGDKQGLATLLHNVANITADQGDTDTAQALYEESLQIRRELGNKAGIASSLTNLGNVVLALDDLGRARTLFTEALSLQRELGNKRGIANVLHSLGLIAYEMDDFTATHIFYTESLALYQESGYARGIACTLQAMGALALTEGQMRRAVTLVSAAEVLREEIASPMTPHEQRQHETLLAQAGAALGEPACSLVRSEGAALSLEQVIEFAQIGRAG